MTTSAYAWMGITTTYTNSGGTPTVVKYIKKVPAPTYTAEDIDVTDQDSAGVKEFIAGLKEGSEVEFVMNDVPSDAGQIALTADEGNTGSMKHVFPSGRSIEYPITIKTVNIIEDGKAGALSVKGKVSGTILKATDDIKLTGLTLGTGTLVPAFGADVHRYTVQYAHATANDTVTPTATGQSSLTVLRGTTTTTITGGTTAATITLADGITEVIVTVKGTGKTTNTYTILMSRLAA
jgi:predicted secreted protein